MSVSSPLRGSPPKRLHHFPAKEVAIELALMDGEMLRRVSPEEIKNGAWMHKTKKHELAPNVMAMVQSFNRLALLVPTEILEKTTAQARAKVTSAFVQIASKCYSLRNYNSLKAILAGLQCTPIYRLERTWKEVPSKRRKCFRELSAVVSEENNWAQYRCELQRQLATGSPCIPFLGAFLTTIVQKESYDQIKSKRSVDTNCESMYTVLEAITVRHRLEKLTHGHSFDLPFDSSSDSDGSGSEDSSAANTPVLSTQRRLRISVPDESNGDIDTKDMEQDVTSTSGAFSGANNYPVHTERVYVGSGETVCPVNGSLTNSRITDSLPKLNPLDLNSKESFCGPSQRRKDHFASLSAAGRRRLFTRERSLSIENVLDAIHEPDFPLPAMKHSSSLNSMDSLDGNDDIPSLTLPGFDTTQSLPIHTAAKKCNAVDDDSVMRARRRCTAHVPRLQVARVDGSSLPPSDLLTKYQFMSLGCCVGCESKDAIRGVLVASGSNSEAANYKLSHEREPE